jgi:hypothetical protein
MEKAYHFLLPVDTANRHDKMLVKETLDGIIIERPLPDYVIQNICMDKGYDFPYLRKLVEELGILPIYGDVEKKKEKKDIRSCNFLRSLAA